MTNDDAALKELKELREVRVLVDAARELMKTRNHCMGFDQHWTPIGRMMCDECRMEKALEPFKDYNPRG